MSRVKEHARDIAPELLGATNYIHTFAIKSNQIKIKLIRRRNVRGSRGAGESLGQQSKARENKNVFKRLLKMFKLSLD